MRDKPVFVPKGVLEGLDEIRESGETNMFDYPRVVELASELGFHETFNWLLDHRKLYSEGVFVGFTSETQE